MARVTDSILELIRFSFFYASSIKRYDYYKENMDDLCDPEKIGKFFKGESERLFRESIEKYSKRIDNILAEIKNGDLDIMTIEDDDYPRRLHNIPDPPLLLYIRGDRSILDRELAVSVVGARKTDDYGIDITCNIASEIARSGFSVVSGLAYGVDVASHKAALSVGGDTVAVLAADRNYPSPNTQTYRKICEKGAVISEYPMGFYVRPDMFLVRNRIIAALSSGTVVVRASMRSGSLSTARAALDYDRDVFAVPGNDYENLSRGTNELLKKGAVPVTSGEDILNFYGFERVQEKQKKENKTVYSEDEKKVLECVAGGKKSTDEICENTGLDIQRVNTLLSVLELKDAVKRHPGNRFTRIDF
jgi:DNA processing protein